MISFTPLSINLCRDSTCNNWIQTGQYQGKLGTIGPANTVHSYAETSGYCGYQASDFGTPPAPNDGYHIAYVDRIFASCNTVATLVYRFAVYDNGDFLTYFYFPDKDGGIPIAKEEVNAPYYAEDLGNDYFGVDNSFNATPGYGVHVLTGASWLNCTGGVEPHTYYKTDAPPYYHGIATYYAFRASD